MSFWSSHSPLGVLWLRWKDGTLSESTPLNDVISSLGWPLR